MTTAIAAALTLDIGDALQALETFKRAAQALDTKQGLINLGVDEAQLKKLSKTLGDTIDKVALARSVKGAAIAGITGDELTKLGKSAAFLAARLGNSKEEMLKMLAAGTQDGDILAALGTSAVQLETAISNAGDGLSEVQKRAVSVRFLMEQASKASNGFTSSTKQQSDNVNKVVASLKNVSLAFIKEITPEINKALGLMVRFIGDAKKVAFWLRSFKSPLDAAKAAASKLDEVFRKGMLKSMGLITKEQKKQITGAPSLLTAAVVLANKQQDAALKLKKTREKADAARKARRKAAIDQAKLEASQEQASRRATARANVRGLNFLDRSLDLISNLGGPLAGIASDSREIAETVGIATALYGKQVVELARSDKKLDLINAKNKGLVKTAFQLRLAFKSANLDLQEFVDNEKKVGIQLKISQALTGQRRAELQKEILLLDQKKEITAAQLTLERIERVFKATKNVDLSVEIARLKKAKAAYSEIVKTQQKSANFAIEIAKIADLKTKLDKQLQQRKTLISIESQITAEQAKRKALDGGLDPVAVINAETAAKRQQIALTIEGLRNQIFLARAEKKERGDAGQKATIQTKIDGMVLQIALQKQLSEEVRRTAEAQVNLTTASGQFFKAARDKAIELRAQLGPKLFETAINGVQAFGQALGNAFAALGQEDFGTTLLKGVLEAIAGMADAWGAFYAALAVADIASGVRTGQGIAEAAAAVGLFATAGLIRAGSASIGGAKSGGGGSSSSAPTQRAPVGTTTGDQSTERNFFFSFGSDPTDKRTAQQKHLDLGEHVRQMDRSTGMRRR